MILGKEELNRIEELQHHEELLFNAVDYLRNMLIKNNIGYSEELNIFKKYMGFTDDDLEYLGIKDYDLEEELEREC